MEAVRRPQRLLSCHTAGTGLSVAKEVAKQGAFTTNIEKPLVTGGMRYKVDCVLR